MSGGRGARVRREWLRVGSYGLARRRGAWSVPVGTPYGQALAIWRHRLDPHRAETLAAIRAVHAASVRSAG